MEGSVQQQALFTWSISHPEIRGHVSEDCWKQQVEWKEAFSDRISCGCDGGWLYPGSRGQGGISGFVMLQLQVRNKVTSRRVYHIIPPELTDLNIRFSIVLRSFAYLVIVTETALLLRWCALSYETIQGLL